MDVVEYSFGLMKNRPKTLLPQVLTWIPSTMMGILIYFAFLDIITLGFSNLSVTVVINLIIKYAAPAAVLFIISFLVGAYVRAVYPSIVRQSFSAKNIMLTNAFAVAKIRFWKLVWTDIVVFVMVLLGIAVAAVIGLVLFTILRSVPVISALLLVVLFVGFIAAVLYTIPGLFMLSTVVVLENISGINAIKRSFALAKGRIWPIWGVLTLLGIFSVAINSLVAIPAIGIFLVFPASMLVSAWSMNASTSYYFLREKKMKPKL